MLKYYYKYKYIKFSKITKKAVFKQSSKRWNNLGQSMNHNAWTPPPPKKKVFINFQRSEDTFVQNKLSCFWRCIKPSVLDSNWTLQGTCQYLHLSLLLGRPNFIFGYQRNVVPSGTLASFLKVGCQLHDTSNLRKMSATKIGIATCLFLICRSNNI